MILNFHGGVYVIGSAATSAPLASDLARRTGAKAVTLHYRLAPEHPSWPTWKALVIWLTRPRRPRSAMLISCLADRRRTPCVEISEDATPDLHNCSKTDRSRKSGLSTAIVLD